MTSANPTSPLDADVSPAIRSVLDAMEAAEISPEDALQISLVLLNFVEEHHLSSTWRSSWAMSSPMPSASPFGPQTVLASRPRESWSRRSSAMTMRTMRTTTRKKRARATSSSKSSSEPYPGCRGGQLPLRGAGFSPAPLPLPQVAWQSSSNRRNTAALACSPEISTRSLRRGADPLVSPSPIATPPTTKHPYA